MSAIVGRVVADIEALCCVEKFMKCCHDTFPNMKLSNALAELRVSRIKYQIETREWGIMMDLLFFFQETW